MFASTLILLKSLKFKIYFIDCQFSRYHFRKIMHTIVSQCHRSVPCVTRITQHQKSSLRPQPSDFRLQTSDLNLQTSNMWNRNLIPQTSDFIPQTSDFRLHPSSLRPQPSDFIPQTSDFRLQTSDLNLQTSDFRPPTSDLRLQTSNFIHQFKLMPLTCPSGIRFLFFIE